MGPAKPDERDRVLRDCREEALSNGKPGCRVRPFLLGAPDLGKEGGKAKPCRTMVRYLVRDPVPLRAVPCQRAKGRLHHAARGRRKRPRGSPEIRFPEVTRNMHGQDRDRVYA